MRLLSHRNQANHAMLSAALLAAPPGMGDLCLFSPEWVTAARIVLEEECAAAAAGLTGVAFTLCEVAHNPPWHSCNYGHAWRTETKPYTKPKNSPGRVEYGTKLAFWARFEGGSVEVHEGELPDEECDYKLEGDHSVMSRLARVLDMGVDPKISEAARNELIPQSKWKTKGGPTANPSLAAVLSALHDKMAARTIPRYVWMSPHWVTVAREIVTARATNKDLQRGREPQLSAVDFVFSEEFGHPPAYIPDPACGFWVACKHGKVTVGHGALPGEYGEADLLTKGEYVPTLCGGRTINGALNKEEFKMLAEANKYFPAEYEGRPSFVAVQKLRDEGRPMPLPMSLCMAPLHEELSLRASGEMPSDFDPNVDDGGAKPFDRHPEYKETWLRYDKVDIYGQPLMGKSKL